MKFVWIPSGGFLIGVLPGDSGAGIFEKPAHEVQITRGIWLGKYPVTQPQWHAVMRNSPSYFQGSDRPVE